MAKSIRKSILKVIPGVKSQSVRDKAPDGTFLFACPKCTAELGFAYSRVTVTFTDVREDGRELYPDKVNMQPEMRCARCDLEVAYYTGKKWAKVTAL